jgi:hypothetical protein
MDLTPSDMVTFIKPEQPVNADMPMELTLLGMFIDVNPEQPSNA